MDDLNLERVHLEVQEILKKRIFPSYELMIILCKKYIDITLSFFTKKLQENRKDIYFQNKSFETFFECILNGTFKELSKTAKNIKSNQINSNHPESDRHRCKELANSRFYDFCRNLEEMIDTYYEEYQEENDFFRIFKFEESSF